MKTEQLLSATGETVEYAKLYLEQKTDYFKLEVAKQSAKTTSNLVTVAVLGGLGLFVLFLFTMSIGFYLGELLESYGTAFLILTGFYLFLAIVIYFFRKQIITNPLLSMIIKNMLD